MSSEPEYRIVSVEVEAVTEKAVFIREQGTNNADWIPRSMIDGGDELVKDDKCDVEINAWILKKKGW